MNIRAFFVALGTSALAVISASLVPVAPVSASAVVPLPAGAGDFVPVVDLGSALTDLAAVSATPCTVKSSNITQLTTGDPLTLPFSDLARGLAIATELRTKSDSLVALSCSASLSVAGSEKLVTGTISSAALALDGTFSLRCTFKQDLKVEADLSLGSALPRGASVSVRSADKTIPVTCSMAATFTDGTLLGGSVDGVADVGVLKSDSCTGDTRVSCVPLLITAKVTVTSTTGKLAGYTGSGTYELTPAFTLSSLNDNLSTVQQAIGKSSVRSNGVSTFSAGAKSGSMKIDFAPGAARTDIVYPVVASDGTSKVGVGSLISATGPRSTRCTYALARGKKSVTVAAFTSASNGMLPTRSLTKRQYDSVRKTLKVKAGSTLNLVAACGKARATQTVTLG